MKREDQTSRISESEFDVEWVNTPIVVVLHFVDIRQVRLALAKVVHCQFGYATYSLVRRVAKIITISCRIAIENHIIRINRRVN
jgi:hypothetical protein